MQSVHSPGAGPFYSSGRPCDIQIKLFEGTNVIQFLYHQKGAAMNPFDYVGGGAIGLNGFNTPSFIYKTVSTGLTQAPSTDIQFTPPVVCSSPAVTSSPTDVTVCSGQSAMFNVSATGTALSYQWRKNGNTISGATGSTYSIASSASTDNGSYDVVVNNSCGTVTSNSATLTVQEPPAITSSPADVTVCSGQSATFTVSATGTGLSYQWRKDGNTISGATSSTYSIASTVAADNGLYDVVVNGSCGTATSNSATLTVQEPPAIASSPADATVCTGQTATFSVGATGAGLSYQWRKDGNAISGATNSTYSIASCTTADNGAYDVVIDGTCGSVTSTSASLTVQPTPSISVSVSPSTIWPANHQMVTVTASVSTGGGCTLCGPLSVVLISVTSNESNSSNDIQNASTGTDDRSVSLRAERAGNGTGRIYTLIYRVSDCNGDSALASATVSVPHDNGSPKTAPEGGLQSLTTGDLSSITILPNPASTQATISIEELPANLHTTIEVVDQTGRRVALLYDATPDCDVGFRTNFNTSELPSGTYFVREGNAVVDRTMKFQVAK